MYRILPEVLLLLTHLPTSVLTGLHKMHDIGEHLTFQPLHHYGRALPPRCTVPSRPAPDPVRPGVAHVGQHPAGLCPGLAVVGSPIQGPQGPRHADHAGDGGRFPDGTGRAGVLSGHPPPAESHPSAGSTGPSTSQIPPTRKEGGE